MVQHPRIMDKLTLSVTILSGCCGVVADYFSMCEHFHIEAIDKQNRTALHYACMYGHGEMVDLLLSHGGNSMEFSVCIFWLMQRTCDFLGIVSKFRF